jgi:hypothetical protein
MRESRKSGSVGAPGGAIPWGHPTLVVVGDGDGDGDPHELDGAPTYIQLLKTEQGCVSAGAWRGCVRRRRRQGPGQRSQTRLAARKRKARRFRAISKGCND